MRKSNQLKSEKFEIQKITFNKTHIIFFLSDRRQILIPIDSVPEIQRLKPSQRKKITVTGESKLDTFLFDHSDSVFRLTDDFRILEG